MSKTWGKAMANYPYELAQDAVYQSHTGRLTGLWFLPKLAQGLNTNNTNVCVQALLSIKRMRFHSGITDVQLHETQIGMSKMGAMQGIYRVSYFYCSAQFCVGIDIRKDHPSQFIMFIFFTVASLPA
jgi:hypothetical protein